MNQIDIPLPDSSATKISVFENGVNGNNVVILFPAMGVAASYYENFAKALSSRNSTVITADLRGLGHSSARPSPRSDFGFREMLELDYKGIISKAHSLFPGKRIYILGHSLGGILGSLYISKHPDKVDGLILIASVNIYYKGWRGFDRWKTLFGTQFFYLLSSVLGYFPGHRVGFGGKGAARVIKDWSYTARTGKYKVEGVDFDFEKKLKDVISPVLAISFSKDELAPLNAVENLLSKFNPQAVVTREHLENIQCSNKPYSHYNWVKNPNEVAERIAAWLTSQKD